MQEQCNGIMEYKTIQKMTVHRNISLHKFLSSSLPTFSLPLFISFSLPLSPHFLSPSLSISFSSILPLSFSLLFHSPSLSPFSLAFSLSSSLSLPLFPPSLFLSPSLPISYLTSYIFGNLIVFSKMLRLKSDLIEKALVYIKPLW